MKLKKEFTCCQGNIVKSGNGDTDLSFCTYSNFSEKRFLTSVSVPGGKKC